MKNLFIKSVQIISFLIIILPDKILLPNGLVMFATIIFSINSLFIEELNLEIYIQFGLALVTSISLSLIFLKNRRINLLGLFVQVFYLLFVYKKGDLNNAYYLITISIYLTATGLLIYHLYCKHNTEQIS
jgi:hypothetical protein